MGTAHKEHSAPFIGSNTAQLPEDEPIPTKNSVDNNAADYVDIAFFFKL